MQSLRRITNPAFLEPVADLGVTLGFGTLRGDDINGVWLCVPGGATPELVASIKERAVAEWYEAGKVCVTIAEMGDAGGPGKRLWCSRTEDRNRALGLTPEYVASLAAAS